MPILRGSGAGSTGVARWNFGVGRSLATSDPLAPWRAKLGTLGASITDGRYALLETMVRSLMTPVAGLPGGPWGVIDHLVVAGENVTQYLLDFQALRVMTNHGSVYTNDRGLQSDGTTLWADTGYNPSLGTKLSQNSMHVMGYTNNFSVGFVAGCNDNVGIDDAIYAPYSDTLFYPRINSGFAMGGTAPGVSAGCFIADRIDASNVVPNVNGSDLTTTAFASSAPVNFNMYLGMTNQGGTATSSFAGSSRCAAFSAGGSLVSTAGRAALASAITTFLTAIGAN
jgi:hypothetical protein